MNPRRHDDSSIIKVGNIQSSTGIAIGNNAHVAINEPGSSPRDEIASLLDEFIRTLESYGDSLVNEQGIRKSATAVRAEIARPSPKWPSVRRGLAMIATSVAGIAALTDAINNIQALVSRITG